MDINDKHNSRKIQNLFCSPTVGILFNTEQLRIVSIVKVYIFDFVYVYIVFQTISWQENIDMNGTYDLLLLPLQLRHLLT